MARGTKNKGDKLLGSGKGTFRGSDIDTTTLPASTEARAAGEAASRKGGDMTEAVARIANSGGGELTIKGSDVRAVTSIVAKTPYGIFQAENGDLAALVGGQLKLVDRKGKEIETGRTVTVQIVENGISAVKMGGKDGVFRPIRKGAEITEDQRTAILGANPVAMPKGLPGPGIQLPNISPNREMVVQGGVLPDLTSRRALTFDDFNTIFKVKSSKTEEA